MSVLTRFTCVCTVVGMALVAPRAGAGDLNPPGGPIAPTPGPEPRTPINLTNTPGDANSLFKITAPGSYYLTGNITGVAAKHGIEIESSGVTVDLMGFDLVGVAGSLDGVNVTTAGFVNIEVRNGSVRSWGTDGVDLSTSAAINSIVLGVRANSNGANGVRVGQGSRITDCIAQSNSFHGMVTTIECVVTGCVAQENGAVGIVAGSGSVVSGCVCAGNLSGGMDTGLQCRIMGCTSIGNGFRGLNANNGCIVSNCIAASNTEDGICVTSDCCVAGNTCDGNGLGTGDGAGILITGADNRIEGNNCIDNDRGIDVDAAGNIIIRNTCSGNTTANWDIVANNVCGPVLDRTAPASAAIVGNSGVSSLGSTDPNANFTY